MSSFTNMLGGQGANFNLPQLTMQNGSNLTQNMPQGLPEGNWFDKLAGSALSTNKQQGWLSGGASALADIGKLYTGLNQIDLAKQQMAMQKQIYNTQVGNETNLYNARTKEQYLGMHPGDLTGLEQYMKDHTRTFERI